MTLTGWCRRRSAYKSEDEANRDRVAAKTLWSPIPTTSQTVEDEKLRGKISDQDKNKILDKCQEVINWLDRNQMAEKDEYEHKQKELERVCNPIISKLYQAAALAAVAVLEHPGTDHRGSGLNLHSRQRKNLFPFYFLFPFVSVSSLKCPCAKYEICYWKCLTSVCI